MCQAVFEITWDADRQCTIAIGGDVDYDRVETLGDALATVRSGDPRTVLLDLRSLRYACVPAYSLFLAAAVRLRGLVGCVVRFVFAEPSIHERVLTLLGVAVSNARPAFIAKPDERSVRLDGTVG